MEKELNPNEYISLTEASKLCSYSQEYLSLRARQGKLKAVKMGRNWVTSRAWLNDYIKSTQYISLQEAAKKYPYSQEYLSLRARQKKLRAIKLDSKWVTTNKWLDDYMKQVKVEEEKLVPEKKVIPKEKIVPKGTFLADLVKFDLAKTIFPKVRGIKSGERLGRIVRRRLTLEQILEKFIGRPTDKGLAFIGGLASRVTLFISRIKNITLGTCRKLHQPKFALGTILVILLIISSILIVSPRARTPLARWTDKIGQSLSKAQKEMADFVFVQSQRGVSLTQKSLRRGEKAVDYLVQQASQFPQAMVNSYQLADQKNEKAKLALKSKISQLTQVPQKMVIAYQLADQKNEQARLAVKLKIFQLVQASPGLIDTSFEVMVDNLRATPVKIEVMLTRIDQSFELLAVNLIRGIHSTPERIGILIERFQENQVKFITWLKIKKEVIVSILGKCPGQASQSLVRLANVLSNTFSDTGKNLAQKLIISTGHTGLVLRSSLKREAASFLEIVTHLNQEISQGWNEFAKSIPQLPQEARVALTKIKSKLGEAYLKIVYFFEGKKSPLVYRPKEIFDSIDELEESIIEDIQVRFAEFRGDLKTTDQEKEGLIVVPLEEEKEKETRQKMEELSRAFSDEVTVEPDETGKAGVIQPIFREDHLQKYLYMMVPVKKAEGKEIEGE